MTTSDEDQNEEVARAMYGEALPGRDWMRCPDDVRHHWRRYARVALDAAFAALTTAQEGDVRARLAAVLEAHNDTMHPDDQKKCGCGKTIGYAESGAIYRYEQEHLLDEIFAAFPALSRATVPDAATELAQLMAERDAGKQAEADRAYLHQLGLKLGAERDAALAAIERGRNVLELLRNYAEDSIDTTHGMLSASFVKTHVEIALSELDEAPEPDDEWEYRRVRPDGVPVFNAVFETMPLLDDYYTAEYRTVSPWLPVEGES